MLEVMFVGLMVTGAVLTVTSMQDDPVPKANKDGVVDQSELNAFLQTYSGMPSKNDTIRFSNMLEEWSIQERTGQGNDVWQRVQANWPGVGGRLWLQHQEQTFPMMGPPSRPLGPVQVAGELYTPNWGVTLARPGMTPYNPSQGIAIDLLPLEAAGVMDQAGMHYTVTTKVSDSDNKYYTHYTYGDVRAANDQQNLLHPVQVRFEDALGNFVDDAEVTDVAVTPSAQVWQVHLNVTAPGAGAGEIWWDRGIVRVSVPAGWDFDSLHAGSAWDVLPQAADESVQRIQYAGTPLRGDDGHTLSFNLTRPLTSTIDDLAVLGVSIEGIRTSNQYLPLHPLVSAYDAPLSVYTSQPEPLVTHTNATTRVHVVNGRDADLTLQMLQIRFAERAYQFRGYETGGTFGPGVDSTEWTYTADNTDAVFTWLGTKAVPSATSLTVALDLRVAKAEGHGAHRFLAPVLTIEDADGNELERVTPTPNGNDGGYRALLPPFVADGDYSIRVLDNAGGSPPGVGAFTVKLDAAGLLDGVQSARHQMRLDAVPRIHSKDQPVQLRLDTADLLTTLRGMDAVDPDSLRLKITSTDLLGYFTGVPNTEAEFPVHLNAGTPIVGIDFADVGGSAVDDVIVSYQNGHILALDGAALPDELLWSSDLLGDLTGPPVWFDVDGDNVDELVYGTTRGNQDRLEAITVQGDVIALATLSGYPSHLTVSECNPGLWFQESDLDRAFGEHLVNNNGFLSNVPTDTRLVHWAPDGTLKRGLPMGNANPYSIVEARFAPFGGCSVVHALEGPPLSDPHARIVRYNATTMDEQWTFDKPGHIRGFWVRDLVATPIERPTIDNPNPARSNEIILVTDEFGIEVLSGWTVSTRPYMQDFLPAGGVDKLIGLSWVNHDVGYLASKMGKVWKTTNAGGNWTEVEGSPIVDAPSTLVDFAFGGDGSGVFRRDDDAISGYSNGGLNSWDPFVLNPWQVAGLFNAGPRPGIVDWNDPGSTKLRAFAPGLASIGDPIVDLPCQCSKPRGSWVALAGGDGVALEAAGGGWSLGLNSNALAVSASPDGWIIGKDSAGILLANATASRTMQPLDTATISVGSTTLATSSMQGADLIDGSVLYSVNDGILSTYMPSVTGWTNTSIGHGARWLLNDTGISRVDPSNSYWYHLRPPAGLSVGESYGVIIDSPFMVHDPTVYLHAADGGRATLSEATVASAVWESGSLVEVRMPGIDSPQTGSGLSLTMTIDGDSIALSASNDTNCNACLVPVGGSDDIAYGAGIWADSDGLMPTRVVGPIGPDPVLVQRANQAPILYAGDLTTGLFGYAMDSGMATAQLDPTMVQPGESWAFGATATDDGNDVMWAEVGVDAATNLAGSSLAPYNRFGDAIEVRLFQVNPSDGTKICSHQWLESDSVGSRILVAVPETETGLLSGTGMGRFGFTDGDDCKPEWEKQPSDIGTVLVVNVEAPVGDWLGPQIYLADLIVDVAPIGEVTLHLMDYSIRSDQGLARPNVYYWMFLEIYDPGAMWR